MSSLTWFWVALVACLIFGVLAYVRRKPFLKFGCGWRVFSRGQLTPGGCRYLLVQPTRVMLSVWPLYKSYYGDSWVACTLERTRFILRDSGHAVDNSRKLCGWDIFAGYRFCSGFHDPTQDCISTLVDANANLDTEKDLGKARNILAILVEKER